MDRNIINELAGKLAKAVPGEMQDLKSDLESNFRSLLQSGLGKLDLVTREEFNIQTKVLERTREKLERLERELEELQATDLNVDTQKSSNGCSGYTLLLADPDPCNRSPCTVVLRKG